MSLEVNYEVQTLTEIWRLKECTLTVMYPTHNSAVIMGMRGVFKREHYQAMNNIFHSKGIEQVIFERDIQGKLQTKIRKVTCPYDDIIATTFERKE